MKYLLLQPVYIIIFLFANSVSIQGQTKDDQMNYYNWFDSQVGIENTGLYNGIRYKELYRVWNGKHKFYKSSEFTKGKIVYQNQAYSDIELKYDLFDDQLLINLETKTGNSIFLLIKEFVDSFTINNIKFVNLFDHKVNNSSNSIQGFYEIAFSSPNLSLYKKHSKFIIKHYNKKVVLSEFKTKETFYFYFNGDYYLINSKGDATKAFPIYKKEINTFYSKNKFLLKSNYDLFLRQLSKQLSSLNLKKIQ